eukprot:scaffold69530_cov30-Tisochrysis_lutea.AAC.2
MPITSRIGGERRKTTDPPLLGVTAVCRQKSESTHRRSSLREAAASSAAPSDAAEVARGMPSWCSVGRLKQSAAASTAPRET